MKIRTSDKFIAWLTLFSGLSISAVAVYYSVAGLVSIFAAAVIPIMVMGVTLELSKLVATVWLKMNWHRAPLMLRSYLLTAIVVLMIITSMGIFGYLSKAHLDQAVPTGDVAAKVQMLDDKIKTEQDNIVAAKAALTQMDNQVNERLSRSTDDRGAERAVQIRKNQSKERKTLQADIATAQKEIAKLREQRAPIASELRKVEAEVGPIKYIAAFIYGDNPDANLLERAVRWVIIIIVTVFDPLAVVLLLASQYSFQWMRRQEEEDAPKYELDDGPLTNEQITQIKQEANVDDDIEMTKFFDDGKKLAQDIDANDGKVSESFLDKHAYLLKPWVWNTKETVGPQVADSNINLEEGEEETVKDKPILITRIAVPESNPDVIATVPHDDGLIQHHTNLDVINNVDVKVSNKEFDPQEYYEYIDETGAYEPRKNDPLDVPVLEGEEMWAQEAIDESWDDEDEEIISGAIETEKAAMHAWKHDNPNGSLKHQRRLLALGKIESLPWLEYLKAQPDEGYVQNAEQSSDTIWQRVKKAKTDEQ